MSTEPAKGEYDASIFLQASNDAPPQLVSGAPHTSNKPRLVPVLLRLFTFSNVILYLGAEMIKIKSSEMASQRVMIHQCKGDLALLQPVTSVSPNLQCLLK